MLTLELRCYAAPIPALCSALHKAEIGIAGAKLSEEGRDYISLKPGADLREPFDYEGGDG